MIIIILNTNSESPPYNKNQKTEMVASGPDLTQSDISLESSSDYQVFPGANDKSDDQIYERKVNPIAPTEEGYCCPELKDVHVHVSQTATTASTIHAETEKSDDSKPEVP